MTNVSVNSIVAIRAESLTAAPYLGQILKSRPARVRSGCKQNKGEWDERKDCAAPVAPRRLGNGGGGRLPGVGGDRGCAEPSDVLAVQLGRVFELQQPEPAGGCGVRDRERRRRA